MKFYWVDPYRDIAILDSPSLEAWHIKGFVLILANDISHAIELAYKSYTPSEFQDLSHLTHKIKG